MKKIATAFWSFPSSELSELHFFCKNKKSRTKAYRAIFTLKIAFHPGFPQDNLYFLTNSWTYKLVKLFPNYYLNVMGPMISRIYDSLQSPFNTPRALPIPDERRYFLFALDLFGLGGLSSEGFSSRDFSGSSLLTAFSTRSMTSAVFSLRDSVTDVRCSTCSFNPTPARPVRDSMVDARESTVLFSSLAPPALR